MSGVLTRIVGAELVKDTDELFRDRGCISSRLLSVAERLKEKLLRFGDFLFLEPPSSSAMFWHPLAGS
jgi:fermentation-respiration switch protein FrsA (DUF1100 family)